MRKEELIESVQTELGAEGYPAAAESALKHDLDALKREYACRIHFKRSEGTYTLEDLGELALLELPDACMEALSFLDASFPAGSALPEHANIRNLIERVVRLLPRTRQETYQRQRGSMALDMVGRVPNRIDRTVLTLVRRAVEHRQELVFDYLGLFDHDTPRRHRVAPYRIFFRPEGHGYLDATLLEATPPGKEPLHAAIDYRLDRIIPGTVKILPDMLPPQRIAPPTYTLRYHLLPVVARRRDVASYFPQTHIAYHEDGSATVTAVVTNLWQTRQILLRYGTGCVVLEPPELVDMFRETAQGLAQMYGAEDDVAQERGAP
jgi:predicted DNA-binding transcriptional regulator YafY